MLLSLQLLVPLPNQFLSAKVRTPFARPYIVGGIATRAYTSLIQVQRVGGLPGHAYLDKVLQGWLFDALGKSYQVRFLAALEKVL